MGDPTARDLGWRVTAKGVESEATDPDPEVDADAAIHAHRWIESQAPQSTLSVERMGSRVVAALTVQASDAEAAEAFASSLLAEAFPSIGFTDVIAERETVDRVMRSPTDPSCSFCGKAHREVRRLIVGAGACICDECVETMAEIVHEGSAER